MTSLLRSTRIVFSENLWVAIRISLLICISLGAITKAQAQLDTLHYIPPFGTDTSDNELPGEVFLYISTPSSNVVNFTITDAGATNTLYSGTVTAGAPYRYKTYLKGEYEVSELEHRVQEATHSYLDDVDDEEEAYRETGRGEAESEVREEIQQDLLGRMKLTHQEYNEFIGQEVWDTINEVFNFLDA